eukprot:767892-Hanusia_phi.AAC.2
MASCFAFLFRKQELEMSENRKQRLEGLRHSLKGKRGEEEQCDARASSRSLGLGDQPDEALKAILLQRRRSLGHSMLREGSSDSDSPPSTSMFGVSLSERREERRQDNKEEQVRETRRTTTGGGRRSGGRKGLAREYNYYSYFDHSRRSQARSKSFA